MNKTCYAVKVNGQMMKSLQFNTYQMAEQWIMQQDKSKQQLIEIVTVTSDGKEILFD